MATTSWWWAGCSSPLQLWAKQNKVEICHLDQETGQFELISVSDNGNAVSAHLAHGEGNGKLGRGYVAGGMLWLSRNRLSWSYSALTARSRSQVAGR
jgi:hypothetical protein